MFLVSVARRRQLSNGAWLNGKIGIWLVIETVKAKRTSKKRAAGDIETKWTENSRSRLRKRTSFQLSRQGCQEHLHAPSGSSRTAPSCTPGMGSLQPLRQWLGKTIYWKPSHPTHLMPMFLTWAFSTPYSG
ncbi:unnamed protein product [Discosporangium mesarthrocarpum]